jgi:hypothetical protein
MYTHKLHLDYQVCKKEGMSCTSCTTATDSQFARLSYALCNAVLCTGNEVSVCVQFR